MSDLPKNMAASFDKWLQQHAPTMRPLLHSQIVKQVEEMMATVARLEGRECYQQALSDTADRLHEVARWCKENGFDARARHTDSAARRVAAATPAGSCPGHTFVQDRRACLLCNPPETPAHLNPLGNASTCENAERHIARLSEYLGEANDEIERLKAVPAGAPRVSITEGEYRALEATAAEALRVHDFDIGDALCPYCKAPIKGEGHDNLGDGDAVVCMAPATPNACHARLPWKEALKDTRRSRQMYARICGERAAQLCDYRYAVEAAGFYFKPVDEGPQRYVLTARATPMPCKASIIEVPPKDGEPDNLCTWCKKPMTGHPMMSCIGESATDSSGVAPLTGPELAARHGFKPHGRTVEIPAPSPSACVSCGHSATRHAVDDEERRECYVCGCRQYRCAK